MAITRTPFATPLILTTLSGHPEVSRDFVGTSAALMGALLLLLATSGGALWPCCICSAAARVRKERETGLKTGEQNSIHCMAGDGAVAVLQPGVPLLDGPLPIYHATAGPPVRRSGLKINIQNLVKNILI